MDRLSEKIEHEILAEYEDHGAVDIARWIQRFPDAKHELLDYWGWLRGSPRVSESLTAQGSVGEPELAEEALRDACLSITLGPQLLEPSVEPPDDDVAQIALHLQEARRRSRRVSVKAPVAFRKAVVWTWITSVFEGRRSRVTRLAVQKGAYLLEQALDLQLFREHQQKPHGPYDHRARYADAEPIAVKKGWLVIRGTSFRTGESAHETETYVARYLGSKDVATRFVEYVARFSDDELETLATVLWAYHALKERGVPETVSEIRGYLAEVPEWRPKLRRPSFSTAAVTKARSDLVRLGFLLS